MPELTVIILCFNEEDRLEKCLKSVLWADEIIVVDSFSSDQSISIAEKYGVKVLQHPFESYAAQKNWAIPQAKGEWVLIVDADEWVTEELREEIQSLLQNEPDCDGYWIRRRNKFLGKEIRYSGWQNDKVLRLFHRDKGRYDDKPVHEEIVIPDGRIGKLNNYLWHDSYRNICHYIEKLELYSTASAQELTRRGFKPTSFNLVFQPFLKFLKAYFFRYGFLDGKHGLIISMLGSINVAFRFIKLWEKQLDTSRLETFPET